jgi:predicted transcriptional regulator
MKLDAMPAQIREGRALLGWSRDRLAAMAEVTPGSVARIERGNLGVPLATLAAIQVALEKAGVIFIDKNVGGPGVRLRKP